VWRVEEGGRQTSTRVGTAALRVRWWRRRWWIMWGSAGTEAVAVRPAVHC